MPGQLHPDAVCPMCSDPLDALVDTSRIAGMSSIIEREYYHGKKGPHHRRRRKCLRRFVGRTEMAIAKEERAALERPAA